MIKNLDSLHKEVQLNGYLKVENFISSSDAEMFEKKTLKAFIKAKKEHYHIKSDYVKVLSVKQDLAKKVRYFKFLNDIFLNENLKHFC